MARPEIKLSPRLEEWLYDRASKNGISPQEFSLPREPGALHEIPHFEKKKEYQDFLTALVEKDEEIATLKSWIDEAI